MLTKPQFFRRLCVLLPIMALAFMPVPYADLSTVPARIMNVLHAPAGILFVWMLWPLLDRWTLGRKVAILALSYAAVAVLFEVAQIAVGRQANPVDVLLGAYGLGMALVSYVYLPKWWRPVFCAVCLLPTSQPLVMQVWAETQRRPPVVFDANHAASEWLWRPYHGSEMKRLCQPECALHVLTGNRDWAGVIFRTGRQDWRGYDTITLHVSLVMDTTLELAMRNAQGATAKHRWALNRGKHSLTLPLHSSTVDMSDPRRIVLLAPTQQAARFNVYRIELGK